MKKLKVVEAPEWKKFKRNHACFQEGRQECEDCWMAWRWNYLQHINLQKYADKTFKKEGE